MAMIDYGVIAKKNGKIVTTKFFTPMIETLAFECEKDNKGRFLEGEYFVYLGDKDFYIAIYKGSIVTFQNTNEFVNYIGDLYNYATTWHETKFRYRTKINEVNFDIKRFDKGNRYKVRFWYKGDLYEAIYGYGVDLNINSWYGLKKKDRNKLERWLKNK